MLYGIFLSVMLGVSPFVWVIGFLCVVADGGITILLAD